MKKVRIVFFSCEPGGAEVLIPVIKYLQKNNNYAVKVYSYGFGLRRFIKKGVKAAKIKPVEKDKRSFLDSEKPDIVITSATSLPQRDMSEKNIWFNAKKGGVKTIAFVDQWQNYSMRFSGPSKYEYLAYQPDYISCIDSIGKREMEEQGFSRKKLIPLGQPYLGSLKKEYDGLSAKAIRRKLKIDSRAPVFLFVSEAVEENYGHARGYTQFDALRMSARYLMKRDKGFVLLVKLHPKDNKNKFMSLLPETLGRRVVFVQNEADSLECIKIADEILGMTSTMLIEGYILGKRVKSVQPFLKIQDPLLLSRYDYIPRITSLKGFEKSSRKYIKKEIDVKFNHKKFMDLLKQLST